MSVSVNELKKEILEQHTPLSVLLRKAILIAKRQKDTDAEKWMTSELIGVQDGEAAPKHRILSGQPMLFNRFVGWEMVNLQLVKDSDYRQMITSMPIFGPISEIETHAKETSVTLHYGGQLERLIQQNMSKEGIPALMIAGSQFQTILETVRNKLFAWISELPDEKEVHTVEKEPLQIMPEKITLKWLWQYVPIHFWFWFGSLIVSAFVAGVFVGQLSTVQELIGKGPHKIAQPTPSESGLPTQTPTPSPRVLR